MPCEGELPDRRSDSPESRMLGYAPYPTDPSGALPFTERTLAGLRETLAVVSCVAVMLSGCCDPLVAIVVPDGGGVGLLVLDSEDEFGGAGEDGGLLLCILFSHFAAVPFHTACSTL